MGEPRRRQRRGRSPGFELAGVRPPARLGRTAHVRCRERDLRGHMDPVRRSRGPRRDLVEQDPGTYGLARERARDRYDGVEHQARLHHRTGVEGLERSQESLDAGRGGDVEGHATVPCWLTLTNTSPFLTSISWLSRKVSTWPWSPTRVRS